MLYAVIMLALIALDQFVKYAVRINIPLGAHVDFIPRILALTHLENNGAAFSMFRGARWFFVVLTAVIVVIAIWALYSGKIRYAFGRWTVAVVIAGAVGNLIDRIRFGQVTDMFETLFMNFPVFNVADICVVLGGIGFVLYYAFLQDRWEKRDAAKAPEAEREKTDADSL